MPASKKPKRHLKTFSDFDRDLLVRIRLYATAKRIPLYRALEHLAAAGLLSVKDNPEKYDIRIFSQQTHKPLESSNMTEIK